MSSSCCAGPGQGCVPLVPSQGPLLIPAPTSTPNLTRMALASPTAGLGRGRGDPHCRSRTWPRGSPQATRTWPQQSPLQEQDMAMGIPTVGPGHGCGDPPTDRPGQGCWMPMVGAGFGAARTQEPAAVHCPWGSVPCRGALEAPGFAAAVGGLGLGLGLGRGRSPQPRCPRPARLWLQTGAGNKGGLWRAPGLCPSCRKAPGPDKGPVSGSGRSPARAGGVARGWRQRLGMPPVPRCCHCQPWDMGTPGTPLGTGTQGSALHLPLQGQYWGWSCPRGD